MKAENIFEYRVSIHENGTLLDTYTEENKQAEEFQNVKVYAADPWYVPADGEIRNLEIDTPKGRFRK